MRAILLRYRNILGVQMRRDFAVFFDGLGYRSMRLTGADSRGGGSLGRA